jgi:beta-1,4-mannosyl-glycoprotein beta-1,4-N-acetylglucosaminyltransferase
MKKIIDCFIFFNELKMLKFRLKELNEIVDYFIIVEANKTFSNLDKPFYFELNKSDFTDYLDKIIYIKIEDIPQDENPWIREEYQRNSIKLGLESLSLDKDDILIFSDLDEIPDSESLKIIKNKGITRVYNMNQDMYYYNFNCRSNKPWNFILIMNYGSFENEVQFYRKHYYEILPYKGGWHLSYFGNPKCIIEKIKSFSHQEWNTEKYTNEETIQQQILNCEDLFFRNNKETHDFQYISIEENNYLPKYYKMLL